MKKPFLLVVLLFAGGSWQSPPGITGSVLRETTAVLRNAETQWLVFFCLGIYFTAFCFLRFQIARTKAGARGVKRPTIWLAGALLISSVLYAIHYLPSTQALILLGGAVLGQGAGFLKSGRRKAEGEKRKAGNWRSEDRSQRPEVRGRKAETGLSPWLS